jgi:peptidoglycan/LPS O-acetylase OafA/YrhL
MNAPDSARAAQRFRALDGLRGVAALVVLIHHSLLLYPAMFATYQGVVPVTGSVMWWATHTPLKLFTAGGEAVVIFFVLSGFVLTLPVLRPGGVDWMAYYPQRVLRLGIPVVASILLACVWILSSNQTPLPGNSEWVSIYSVHPLDWKAVVRTMDLINNSFALNNPLWSILWELLFSLALPLIVGLALLFRRRWYFGIAGVVALVWLGLHDGALSLQHMPDFFVGALIAVLLSRIRRLAERVAARGWENIVWPIVLAGSLLILILASLVGPLPSRFAFVTEGFLALRPLAAGLIVIVCIAWPPVARLLMMKPVQWAGTISFSLYLVHAPIVIFSRYAFATLPLPAVIAIAIALSLVVAVAFYWAVESRAHAWSRWAGASVSAVYGGRDDTLVTAAPIDAQS